MGSGGSGEGFCSGTEYAGEHFLPSRAAGDLQDRAAVSAGAATGEPLFRTGSLGASKGLGPAHWDNVAEVSVSALLRGEHGKGKDDMLCF